MVGAGGRCGDGPGGGGPLAGELSGLVVTRYGHGLPCRRIEVAAEAAHPVPDAAGETAARRILQRVSGPGPEDRVLVLISGGGSALAAPARVSTWAKTGP